MAIWKDRYASSSLDTSGGQSAALTSVEAFPMLCQITDTPEEYFFTSYHHACKGNQQARQGITTLLGTPNAPWRQVKRRLLKLTLSTTPSIDK